MKSGKKALVLLPLGIFLLLLCIIMPDALKEKAEYLNGVNGFGKIVAAAGVNSDINPSLTPEIITKAAKQSKINEFSYTAANHILNTDVKVEDRMVKASITGTNFMFPAFSRCNMLRGSFFSEDAEKSGGYIAVIDDRFAWEAFRTYKVVGETLELYNRQFKIIGVVKTDASVLSRLAGDNFSHIYIPGEKMLELDKSAAIKVFQFKTDKTDIMDRNETPISAALQAAGYKADDFSITDLNITRVSMEQKPQSIVFFLSCIIAVIVLKWLIQSLKNVITEIRRQCKKDYFINIIKDNLIPTAAISLKILFSAAATGLLFASTTFKIYIPPKYLPDELIDLTFYFKLLLAGFTKNVGGLEYYTDLTGNITGSANLLTELPLILILIAGLLLIYSGVSAYKPERDELLKAVLVSGLSILFSLLLLAAAANRLGLLLTLHTSQIAVVWVFIYTCIWFRFYKQERMNWKYEKSKTIVAE